MKRSAVLALVLAAALASVGSSFGSTSQPSFALPFFSLAATPSVKGADVALSPGELLLDGVQNQPNSAYAASLTTVRAGTFTSRAIESPIAFSHIGIRYSAIVPEGAAVNWEARGSADGIVWTNWYSIEEDDDLPFSADGKLTTRVFGLRENGSELLRFAQVRATLSESPSGEVPSVTSIDVAFIDPTSGPTTAQASELSSLSSTPSAIGKPAVISRIGWGSPDGEASPNWPPDYRTVTHVIIHHTVTSNQAIDWAAEVRAIWYYHAVSLKWGDIGYNYLIDPNGYIYEGRAGGDDVVAGHALQYNLGSLGVAFLGDYSTAYPSVAARNSMINLLSWKADQRGINPSIMSSYLVDKYLPTIMGHRDALNTTCPGNSAYSLIPQIRQAVWDRVASQPASAQIVSAAFEPTTVASGYLLKVSAVVRNNGSVTIQSQGPSPGYVYNEWDQFSNIEAEKFNRFRLAVDLDGRTQSIDHPYRWGLGRDLAPGESTTVTGYIRLTNLKTTGYWAGLVREGISWIADGVARTAVTVVAGDTVPPTVTLSVPSSTPKTWVVIGWSATDDFSGLAPGFDVDYRLDGADWTTWLRGAPGPTALFIDGKPGQRYYFRVKAWDKAGNLGIGTGGPVQLGTDPTGLSKTWFPSLFKSATGGW